MSTALSAVQGHEGPGASDRPLVIADPTLHRLALSPEVCPEVERILGAMDAANEWLVTAPVARLLAGLIRSLPIESVVEFGAGLSSRVLAAALSARGGGRLTSVDHAPEYCRDAWSAAAAQPGVDARLVVSRLRRSVSWHGLHYTYVDARGPLAGRAPFDLVFVDAPPGELGRTAPVHQVFRYLSPGALIVLDDAARGGEVTALRRWLRAYPGLELAFFDAGLGRGVAVCRVGGSRRRWSPRSLAGSVHDEWRRIRRAPRRRRQDA